MSRIRAFLAVNFPIPVIRKIADEVELLRKEISALGFQVAWVPPPNLHVTLKFLGAIEAPSSEAILLKLKRELRGGRPFEMEARGLGAFPSPEAPSVVWAGVHPLAGAATQQDLVALQQNVETWMAEIGFPREERAFHPHVTVGRVKAAGPDPAALAALIGERKDKPFGSGRAVEVVLYESRTLRSGSEYVVLGRASLGAT